ncbi:uncharacterized protein N7473_005739 [Penicillium subrubescens]|jgi:hypothetical protein|uniref:Uncharacterized protein n=1 Tax=Penicillium subrubescens TaxID=1316194 RepID=A0A1Q5SV99_9EURO|nr:uncharacterized protein N7473_005739 [Penicillium subrubescens]KAJ5896340.1 hypothetical protein N7473_005739 [Penicillium subrubescens]OKO91890.1 hypothetical protein PENSUB_12963 [Penicillium subrubescens]
MDLTQISSQLSSSPSRFPDCCLSISTNLLTTLTTLLPKKPAFTLSIGSGSGLLEGLLSHSNASISVEGVEVASTVNRYIAEEDMHVAAGAWDLYARAKEAKAWMFVYPREPKLISRYIETYGGGEVKIIMWLGPKIDWIDHEVIFRESVFDEVHVLEDVGLARYETAVVARRSV